MTAHDVQFDYTLNWDADGRWRPVRSAIQLEGVAPDDHILAAIRDAGAFYELDLLEHIALRGPRGGVFLDVGANLGNHSVYFGKFLADRVVAVEPSPVLLPVLRRNLERNGVRQYTIVPCAVGEVEGAARCVVPEGANRNLGMTRIELAPSADGGDGVVRVTTIDAIWEGVQRETGGAVLSFLKLDIEGMELQALKGAAGVLGAHRPQLAVELGDDAARGPLLEYLGRFGYRIASGPFGWTPTFHLVDPRIHQLRTKPSRIVRSWREGRLRRLRAKLGLG